MLDTYQAHLESLHGHFHRASSLERATDIVMSVARDIEAKCIATAHLSEEFQSRIAAQCEQFGIELLSPPFTNDPPLANVIDRADLGVTGADFGIAETSTLVEVATNDDVRLVSSLPRTHIGVLYEDAIVQSLEDASPLLRKAFAENPENCVVSFLSGPSRTGDIEMRLTLGVHGPENAHTLVIPRGDA